MSKQNNSPELKYHDRCKAICKALGLTLYGTSINNGFAYYIDKDPMLYEMPHAIIEKLESLIGEKQ